MKKRILVCGATGFIGRNCLERLVLRTDYEVVGTYHIRPPFKLEGVTWVRADLTNPEDVNRVLDNVHIVIQAAATTSGSKDIVERPYLHVTDNIVMNSYLLRGAFDMCVETFVFFSCTVMYPSQDQPHNEESFDLSTPLQDKYFGGAWTKIYLEKAAEFYSRIGDTKYIIIRHSNIFGPHDKFDLEHSHVFGATVTKVLTAKDKVTIWGSGKESRDLLYVDDLVDFVESAFEKNFDQNFNLYCCGSTTPISVNKLTDLIIGRSGRQLLVSHDKSKPTIATNISIDCTKAKKDLGWQPKTSMLEGIDRTIAWWQKNNPYVV